MRLSKKEAKRLAKLMLGQWVDEMSGTGPSLENWLIKICPYVTSGKRPPDELLPWTEQSAYRKRKRPSTSKKWAPPPPCPTPAQPSGASVEDVFGKLESAQ